MSKSLGLHRRYVVEKVEGETDPNAIYFVLRLDSLGSDKGHVLACQESALLYASLIRETHPLLAADLEKLVAGERAKFVINSILCNQLCSHREKLENLKKQISEARTELERLQE